MGDPTCAASGPLPPLRLLDQVPARSRLKRYALRTKKVYVDRVKRFVLFDGKRHPRDLGAADVEAFLSYLAVDRRVAASTRIRPGRRCCSFTRKC